MREIRTSGSEGGGTGSSTSSSYPYRPKDADATRGSAPHLACDVRERRATSIVVASQLACDVHNVGERTAICVRGGLTIPVVKPLGRSLGEWRLLLTGPYLRCRGWT